MKKAVIVGKRQAALVEVPDPQPRQEWVVVKVYAAPMCAEYKRFVVGTKEEFLGHEAAGEVVAVEQPGPVKVGDRVVAMPLTGCATCPLCLSGEYIYCEKPPDFEKIHGTREGMATMAQYILKQPFLLCPIPDDVSYERASLACCALGPSFGAFNRMGLTGYDTVLITGAGPVGLGAIVNARFLCARVIVVESVPWRVDRARQMGATVLTEPSRPDILKRIMELTDDRGVDCALECAGAVQAERLCMDATHRRGKVAFIGESERDLAVRVSPDLIRGGMTVIGSWHYNLAHFPKVMRVIRESPFIDLLVSHVIPMSKIQEAFETSASQQCAKIILKPWE